MKLIETTREHIPALVEISKKAFDSDIEVGASSIGGPPEYDSINWHIEMMNTGHLFTAIEENTIVGGAIVFADENNRSTMYLGRIFIEPGFFRKGYGIKIMEQIETMNPSVTTWCLDTPIWNNGKEDMERMEKKTSSGVMGVIMNLVVKPILDSVAVADSIPAKSTGEVFAETICRLVRLPRYLHPLYRNGI